MHKIFHKSVQHIYLITYSTMPATDIVDTSLLCNSVLESGIAS